VGFASSARRPMVRVRRAGRWCGSASGRAGPVVGFASSARPARWCGSVSPARPAEPMGVCQAGDKVVASGGRLRRV